MTTNNITATAARLVAVALVDATRNVAAIRAELQQAAADDSVNNINAKVIQLATAEGVHDVFSLANALLEAGRSGAEVLENVTITLLLAGADDTCSGRGNDARRARFDGVRSAISDLRYTLAG